MNNLDSLLRDLEDAPKWEARRKKKRQRYREVKDLKDSGYYISPKELYLDEDGEIRTDIEVPYWFKNLSKAWATKSQYDMRCFNTVTNPYRAVKPLKEKPKRRDQMITLLEENGFTVEQEKYEWTVFDNQGKSWDLCSNGKVMVDGKVTATYLFISKYQEGAL